jgi:hypothetical protein
MAAIWPTRRRCAGISRVGEKLLEKPAPATTFFGVAAAANNATSEPRHYSSKQCACIELPVSHKPAVGLYSPVAL